MKLNIQLFGGRGAVSTGKRTIRKARTPAEIRKQAKQEEELKDRLTKIKRTQTRLLNKSLTSKGEEKEKAEKFLEQIRKDRKSIEKELEKIKEDRHNREFGKKK